MNLLTKLVKGTAAGLAGAAAMHAFRIAWERMIPDLIRDGIFGFDREADFASAQRLNGLLFRQPLSTESAARLGVALHYVYGGLLGASYAVARARLSQISSVKRIPAGVVLWLAADEVPVTLSGISNPMDKSPASHVSALIAHLVYATAMENVLRRW